MHTYTHFKEFTIYSNVDVVGTLKNKTGIFNSHHEEQTVSLSHTPKVSLVALSRCYLQNTPLPYLWSVKLNLLWGGHSGSGVSTERWCHVVWMNVDAGCGGAGVSNVRFSFLWPNHFSTGAQRRSGRPGSYLCGGCSSAALTYLMHLWHYFFSLWWSVTKQSHSHRWYRLGGRACYLLDISMKIKKVMEGGREGRGKKDMWVRREGVWAPSDFTVWILWPEERKSTLQRSGAENSKEGKEAGNVWKIDCGRRDFRGSDVMVFFFFFFLASIDVKCVSQTDRWQSGIKRGGGVNWVWAVLRAVWHVETQEG